MKKMVEKFKLIKKIEALPFQYRWRDFSHRPLAGDDSGTQEVTDSMWQIIYTIVEKGETKKVVDAARALGARGGTVCHGRGSGSKQAAMLF